MVSLADLAHHFIPDVHLVVHEELVVLEDAVSLRIPLLDLPAESPQLLSESVLCSAHETWALN